MIPLAKKVALQLQASAPDRSCHAASCSRRLTTIHILQGPLHRLLLGDMLGPNHHIAAKDGCKRQQNLFHSYLFEEVNKVNWPNFPLGALRRFTLEELSNLSPARVLAPTGRVREGPFNS